MIYKGFDITTEGFGEISNIDGVVAKFDVSSVKNRSIFAFAVDNLSVKKYNLDLNNLLVAAESVVKSYIDEGLFKDTELTFEYEYPTFSSVSFPSWWISVVE
jgi:hypothetical protein